MGLRITAYRGLARAAAVFPWWLHGVRESLRGRAAATERWAAWSGGRVVWFHGASVGEALTADPVMRRLRAARPDLPVVLTYTSPSVARWPNPVPAARADFAPAEHPAAMERVFGALNPVLLVFSCGDLWPEMLLAAGRRDVPVAVIAGRVRSGSRRLRWPALGFLRPLHQSLRYVGAVSEADAARWRRLGARHEVVHLTGDPRHDQALERVTGLGPVARRPTGPTLVAGSVEPEDAEPLRGALEFVRSRRADAQLIVVPHDPSSGVWKGFQGLPGARVVRTLGELADTYLVADVAYVGGGLRHRHSVIEPAVFAIPVLPPAASGVALGRAWLAWLDNPDAARADGLAGRRAVTTGAASASAGRLLALIR